MIKKLLPPVICIVFLCIIGCTKTKTINGPTEIDTVIVTETIIDTIYLGNTVYIPIEGCLYFYVHFTGDTKDTAVILESDDYLVVDNTKYSSYLRCKDDPIIIKRIFPLHEMVFSTDPWWEE